MTIPVWMLLGFAVWTVMLLLGSVGLYRWSRILTGRMQIKEFRADQVEGQDWYKRAMRAHANCIENLPVFGAIVFVIFVSGLTSRMIDALAVIVLIARICQSIVHVTFEQTNTISSFRFLFFFTQIICFLWLAAILVIQA